MRLLVCIVVLFPLACGSSTPPVRATPAVPPAPGSLEEQVENGAKAFENACATCHGQSLKGSNRAPSVLGKKVLGKNARETFLYIKENMPPDGPGPLTEADYWNLTAFLVKKNGWPVTARINESNAASVKTAP